MKLQRYNIVLRLAIVIALIFSFQQSFADHLKGGWMKYRYISSSATGSTYEITLYEYSDCSEPEKVDDFVAIGVFDAVTSVRIADYGAVAKKTLITESENDFGPCFDNPPTVCYLIAKYVTTVTLANNPNGYIVSSQRCCRIAGIENVPNSNDVGVTYIVTIPGTEFKNDNSPVFNMDDDAGYEKKDAVAICYNSPFTLDFGATDPDGDELVYSFCSGYTGANKLDPKPVRPSSPPYSFIPYNSGFGGDEPMGPNVSIDSKTGIISGTAPAQLGTYVIAVCVSAYRNGKYVSNTRKEIHVDVENCSLSVANLKPAYITCDGYSFNFKNETNTAPEYTYLWDFGVSEISTDTSSSKTPVYTYKDTGVYKVKLSISNDDGCESTASTQLSIFPGFTANFSVDGSCILNPYTFTDKTTTIYGKVNSWLWNFGDASVSTDTSSLQKPPAYSYVDTGIKTITLYATNSKGCLDTATQILSVTKGPQLAMKFRDTLICNIDTLPLVSSSTTNGATFKWAPTYNMDGSNTPTPFVYPKQTTLYNVEVTYKGCLTQDSVLVNVTDRVNLQMDNDTLICATDEIVLTPETNALYFNWSPTASINSVVVKDPVVTPFQTTTYRLDASIGKCNANGITNVAVAPYPAVNAGADQQICYAGQAQLNATINAEQFSWSPPASLLNSTTLTPYAGPASTTSYVLTVLDTSAGKCPKPVSDTVTITVLPKVQAFAGNDTVIVINQPLQLNATGGFSYQWSPSTFLNNSLIGNPIATFTGGVDTVSYRVKVTTEEGCTGYDDIVVHAFETVPQIFVPTGFTPNNDGRNDDIMPTIAGMKQLINFSVFNRWGQMLFTTSRGGESWDGTFKGERQPSGTYVFIAYAVDYNNKPYEKKGTFVLIR